MIAIVTSTLHPAEKPIFEGKRSAFSYEERLEQTRGTIQSLKAVGIEKIFLFDNSDSSHHDSIRNQLRDVSVFAFDHYQFYNRGLSEIMLILSGLKHLPAGQIILKISGRYRLTEDFRMPSQMDSDFVVRAHRFGTKAGVVSTRLYLAKNKDVMEQLMLRSLVAMNAYPYQIVGPRSLWNALSGTRRHLVHSETTISIEMAAARVLAGGAFRVKLLDKIGVEGYLAGNAARERIQE